MTRAESRTLKIEEARAIAMRIDELLRVRSVELLGDGVKSEVWRVSCDDDREFAVKSYKPGHPRAIGQEIAFYAAAGERPELPIPRLLAADTSEGWTALSILSGRPLTEVGDAGPGIYEQLGEFLRSLHSSTMPSFGDLSVDAPPQFASNAELMADKFAWALARYEELGGSPCLAKACAAHVERHRAEFARCEQAVLVHADCHPANLLVEPGPRLSGVVDFESALAGDPLMDLAEAYHASFSRDEATLNALTRGYGELPGGWRARFDLYVMYFSLELWIWFVKGGSPPPHRGIERRIAKLAKVPRLRLWVDHLGSRLHVRRPND
ncbi:MAG: phosphotransferase family protein [Solirubrobacterales bacterium]